MSAHETISYDEPQTWYFTFGVGIANLHRNGYFVIENATGSEARDRMFDTFGREWAFQYDEAGWFKHGVSQAEKYGLTEVVDSG